MPKVCAKHRHHALRFVFSTSQKYPQSLVVVIRPPWHYPTLLPRSPRHIDSSPTCPYSGKKQTTCYSLLHSDYGLRKQKKKLRLPNLWRNQTIAHSFIYHSSLILSSLHTHLTSSICLYSTMRMSCNGCRVLRKGCSEDCTIRPCLQWINSSESQAHATLFLAKFYGRAGLLNLINAGPPHLRSAIFKSLLYEACGRIINPIYGSVGVLSSGKWSVCQDAVDAVLRGEPITPVIDSSSPPKDYDIRHVMKNGPKNNVVNDTVHTLRNRRFKRCRTEPVKSVKPSPTPAAVVRTAPDPVPDVVPIDQVPKSTSSTSRDSCASDVDGGETNTESVVSIETTEPMSLFDAGVVDELTKVKETDVVEEPREYDEVDLRLRLGFGL